MQIKTLLMALLEVKTDCVSEMIFYNESGHFCHISYPTDMQIFAQL